MNEQLLLEHIRDVLMRLEESIIFGLIERAQFAANPAVYKPGIFAEPVGDDSLVGYLLHETEKIHARVRRYTSPDEHPFYTDLPEPILKPLRYAENPLQPNNININDRVRTVYENEILPRICTESDDAQYGSSAVCDVNCLQILSRRIHYGKFVAESKYQRAPDKYQTAINNRDAEQLHSLISNTEVEKQLLHRVHVKARTYGQTVNKEGEQGGRGDLYKIPPEVIVNLYQKWIIPMTKDVEIQYLFATH